MSLILFLTLSLLVSVKECAKILTFIPTPSISHQVPFRPLFHGLAKRGHQVKCLTTDPAFQKGKAPENFTEIDLHESYDIWRKGQIKLVKGKEADDHKVIQKGLDVLLDTLDQQMQNKEVQNIIRGKEVYDLLILEAYISGTLAFRHRFKSPVIQMSAVGPVPENCYTIGAPTHLLLYPLLTRHRIYNLTFWEKINEIYRYIWINSACDENVKSEYNVMRKYFVKDIMLSIDELKNEIDMLFLNIHPIFEGNFPVPLSVLYVWGIHQIPEKELPKGLKSYLDSSKHGVIYISFGTNADPANLPPDKIQMFIRVFSQLPYDVLWKWSKDELPGKSDNIKIGKWFPQSDLLRHPKIRLFITQGGLQSTAEAINSGVPLVGIPMAVDQWYNVEKYAHFKIGEKLKFETLTEEHFKNTVETVINDDSYRKNIKKLGELLKDNPLPPLERTTRWIEYVLRHGGARHLRAPAANMSWIQYYEIQLVSTLLIGLVITFSVVSYSVYALYAFVLRKVLFLLKSKYN